MKAQEVVVKWGAASSCRLERGGKHCRCYSNMIDLTGVTDFAAGNCTTDLDADWIYCHYNRSMSAYFLVLSKTFCLLDFYTV